MKAGVRIPMRAQRCLAGVAAIFIMASGGCAVGPRYVVPASAAPPSFKEAARAAAGPLPPGNWQPAQPQDAALKGRWWEMFNEPELNALEDRLNIDNQNIAQYFQNFMAARAQVREAHAGLFPTVAVNPGFTRTKTSAAVQSVQSGAVAGATQAAATNTGAATVNEFTLPLDVSWEPDLWGRIRNTVREYRAAAQVSAADLENERLTEQAALAVYYFELRGQDSLQDLYDRTIAADRQSLELTRALVDTGIDSAEDVAQAEVTLAGAEEAGAGIAANRALYEHAMATLIGTPASSFSMPVKLLSTPVPPIPVGVPSQLLQRRPDIAAAERAMAQANALIRVETAAYYPSLSLTAGGGFESTLISQLLSAPALFWSLGAAASETIFDAGLRSATLDQYTASYNGDVAAYRQTVLTAFQQVEDYLAMLRVTSRQLAKEDEAVRAAQRYLDIAMARYETGLDPYLNVINAQTVLLTDQQTQVTLRVSEMAAAVQLIQALGGGWDVEQMPSTK